MQTLLALNWENFKRTASNEQKRGSKCSLAYFSVAVYLRKAAQPGSGEGHVLHCDAASDAFRRTLQAADCLWVCRQAEEQQAAAEARHMAVQSLDTNIDEPTRVLLPSGQVMIPHTA